MEPAHLTYENYRKDAISATPDISRLHYPASLVKKFNTMAAAVPFISFAIPAAYMPDIFAHPGYTLAVGALSAACTQVSRWMKAGIREDFESLWNRANTATRPLILGLTKESFDTKIGKSTNVVSYDDLNLRKLESAIPLVSTLVCAAAFPPIAPMVFFGGTQLRERADIQRMENALRYNAHYLRQYQPQ